VGTEAQGKQAREAGGSPRRRSPWREPWEQKRKGNKPAKRATEHLLPKVSLVERNAVLPQISQQLFLKAHLAMVRLLLVDVLDNLFAIRLIH
jgi:hypothetical protein